MAKRETPRGVEATGFPDNDEFGRTGLFSSGVGSAGDPLGHSYQYGERICDYYLGALELPKPSDPKN